MKALRAWPIVRDREISWAEVVMVLGPRLNSGEFWGALCHSSAWPLLESIRRRYAECAKAEEDLTIIAISQGGHAFFLMAAKKDHLSDDEYADLLHRHTGADASVLEEQLQIVAPPDLVSVAFDLAYSILGRDGGDLVLSE